MLDPRTTVVVANPAAAGGGVGRRWPAIERTLRAHLGGCAIRRSGPEGTVAVLAERAVRDGATAVLSLGGDGTHNEVLNGVLRAGRAPGSVALGILPAGTGGDFRRLLTAGASLEEAARALPSASAALIDVGAIEHSTDDGGRASRYFLNIASAGVSGLVDRLVNRSSKRLGGRLTFLLATLRALRRYRPARVRLTVDDRVAGVYDVAVLAVCNGRWAGGGMLIAPAARLADGVLDVVVIRHAPLVATALRTPRLYRGTHVDSPLVDTFRGRHVEVALAGDAPAWVDVDGEAPGVAPATFRVHPGAVRLLGARPEML